MARSKQTPRILIRDRPIAAVGNELHSIEVRPLPRRTNQGRSQAMEASSQGNPCLENCHAYRLLQLEGLKSPNGIGLVW